MPVFDEDLEKQGLPQNTIDWVSRPVPNEPPFLNVLLVPQQVAVSKAHEAFNPDGSLKDAKQQAAVEQLGALVTQILKKLNG